MSCWTLQFTSGKEPGATVAGVQRLGKVRCFITGEKVIFYQSISNDHRPQRAAVLYYRLLQTNLRTQVKRKDKKKNKSKIHNQHLTEFMGSCHLIALMVDQIFKLETKK